MTVTSLTNTAGSRTCTRIAEFEAPAYGIGIIERARIRRLYSSRCLLAISRRSDLTLASPRVTVIPPTPGPDGVDAYLAEALAHRLDIDAAEVHRLVDRLSNPPGGWRDDYILKREIGLRLFNDWTLEDIVAHLPEQ